MTLRFFPVARSGTPSTVATSLTGGTEALRIERDAPFGSGSGCTLDQGVGGADKLGQYEGRKNRRNTGPMVVQLALRRENALGQPCRSPAARKKALSDGAKLLHDLVLQQPQRPVRASLR